MEPSMSDREQSDTRDGAPSESSASGRQQRERAASTKDEQPQDAPDQDGGTASRPRGQTEDPDRTL
jgi:hypothetical protein